MKLISLLVLIICCVGCGRSEKERQAAIDLRLKDDVAFGKQYIDSLRTTDEAKNGSVKEIFLGFKFGMSESQYKSHFDSLVNTKTISQFSKTGYSYSIKIPTEKVPVDLQIMPKFSDAKLVELELIAWGSTNISGVTKSGLLSIYAEKYSTFEVIGNSIYWFNKNLEIELSEREIETDPNLSPLVHAVISYRDNSYFGHSINEKVESDSLQNEFDKKKAIDAI